MAAAVAAAAFSLFCLARAWRPMVECRNARAVVDARWLVPTVAVVNHARSTDKDKEEKESDLACLWPSRKLPWYQMVLP